METGLSEAGARRERARQETRSKILAAARQLLIEQGVSGFSMRKLAQKVALTATAIYFHFPDKEALLGEVVDHQFMAFRQAFEKMNEVEDPIARLRGMGLAYLEFAEAHPDHYRFMFLTELGNIPKGQVIEKGNPSQDCYAFLVATVAEAIAQQRLRPELTDPHQVAQVFFSSIHGLVSLKIIKGTDDWVAWRPIRETARLLIEALVRGLAPAGATFWDSDGTLLVPGSDIAVSDTSVSVTSVRDAAVSDAAVGDAAMGDAETKRSKRTAAKGDSRTRASRRRTDS